MKYRLLALDLDGTLLDPAGRLREENIAAVSRARDAGILVVVCTGRGYAESRRIIERLDARTDGSAAAPMPVVTAGGSIIADAATGRTLHRWPMDRALVADLCSHFAERELAPLLLKDRDAAGFDYLVINSGPLEAPSRWWFSVMDVEVKFLDSLADDEHPEHTVRVGFAAMAAKMHALADSVRAAFGERVTLQHFAAVSGPQGSDEGGKDASVHLLEVFDRQVNKWSAIRHIAAERGIDRGAIAAVGDEVNDLPLLEGAGLGVAMANGIEAVLAVADRVTLGNDSAGVAHAIDNILAGAW